jgi:hypothetical protein
VFQLSAWLVLTRHNPSSVEQTQANVLRTKFAERRMLLIRVAVLRGLNLVPKDKNNLCDPYLVASLGSKKQSHRNQYQKTTAQPQFYTTFEFKVELPGQADLRVAILDHDPAGRFLGDETIGETIIDLEDRWYSDEFQQMCQKKDTDGLTTLMPIEMRQLYDPSGKYRIPQGQLEMWVEMYDLGALMGRMPKMPKLTREEDIDVELRIVIWEASEMEEKDTLTQANDLYIVVVLQVRVACVGWQPTAGCFETQYTRTRVLRYHQLSQRSSTHSLTHSRARLGGCRASTRRATSSRKKRRRTCTTVRRTARGRLTIASSSASPLTNCACPASSSR